ncbi:DMT family transporter [Clostridium sp. AM58-1XD]|uniref:DMT family transporter n=1 Tax=Clostridium sp. AM58-1XD TaxID=2292307 RepID=UPI000E4FEEAA|nr:DMT family transporter [Clostridium sp. AM58-1XD]RGY96008.1 DMT family transporter [Clostridium sp. AM58-1XD]
MNRKRARSNGMLLLTALIWGVAFVAQSVGLDYVGPFTFNGSRFIMGGIVLIPCMFYLHFVSGRKEEGEQGIGEKITKQRAAEKAVQCRRESRITGIIGGICCGICLCVASTLQQMGIAYTTAGKAGFITTLYIVIIPIMGLMIGKRADGKVWVSVLIAVIGLYLLSVKEGFSVGYGEFLIFLCAIAFSVHILVIDYFSPKADGVFISCVQFFTAGLISWIFAFIFETPEIGKIAEAWVPVLYAGIMSCGVAYTLQVVAQRDTDPTVASLILSLEAVFSALAGWAILHQMMSRREMTGCLFVFCAVILAQLPDRKEKIKIRKEARA